MSDGAVTWDMVQKVADEAKKHDPYWLSDALIEDIRNHAAWARSLILCSAFADWSAPDDDDDPDYNGEGVA